MYTYLHTSVLSQPSVQLTALVVRLDSTPASQRSHSTCFFATHHFCSVLTTGKVHSRISSGLSIPMNWQGCMLTHGPKSDSITHACMYSRVFTVFSPAMTKIVECDPHKDDYLFAFFGSSEYNLIPMQFLDIKYLVQQNKLHGNGCTGGNIMKKYFLRSQSHTRAVRVPSLSFFFLWEPPD